MKTVLYRFVADIDEARVRTILERAKDRGAVVDYAINPHVVWFQGPPSAALRFVRREVARVVGDEGRGYPYRTATE